VLGNLDIKKSKPSSGLKIPFIDADKSKIKILPSIKKSKAK
jgi:hypothetical protein